MDKQTLHRREARVPRARSLAMVHRHDARSCRRSSPASIMLPVYVAARSSASDARPPHHASSTRPVPASASASPRRSRPTRRWGRCRRLDSRRASSSRRRPIFRRREQRASARGQAAEQPRRLPRADRQHARRQVGALRRTQRVERSPTSTSCARSVRQDGDDRAAPARRACAPDVVNDIATTTFRLKSERITEARTVGLGHRPDCSPASSSACCCSCRSSFHGQNVLRGVLEEKSTRVAEVVISSVKPETLLAGKVLGVGGVGLTQQIAWLGITGVPRRIS